MRMKQPLTVNAAGHGGTGSFGHSVIRTVVACATSQQDVAIHAPVSALQQCEAQRRDRHVTLPSWRGPFPAGGQGRERGHGASPT